MLDCFWSLYNIKDEIRVDGLRTIQIKALLPALLKSTPDDWMVWQEGTNDWRPAGEITEILAREKNLSNVPPMPPMISIAKEKLTYKEWAEKTQGGSPSEEREPSIRTLDSRMSPRFLHRFKLKINFENKITDNCTLNISIGGLKIETPLSEDMSGKPVAVTLINGSNEMLLNCLVIRPRKKGDAIDRLFIVSCKSMETLRRWILSGPDAAI
jgi:hypothetical protein